MITLIKNSDIVALLDARSDAQDWDLWENLDNKLFYTRFLVGEDRFDAVALAWSEAKTEAEEPEALAYHVCDTCTVVLSNADTSGIDDEDLDRITANVEALGLVAHLGTFDQYGYWSCAVCGYDTIGDSNVFEQVA